MATVTQPIRRRSVHCLLLELAGENASIASGAACSALRWCFGPKTYSVREVLEREGLNVPNADIPPAMWQDLCEQTRTPLACVDADNKFVWVNTAFERLIGYSCAELQTMTWMQVTDQPDVGGDLASVDAIKNGHVNGYSLDKNYRHKSGRKIAVELSVWRFPVKGISELLYLMSEAVPAQVSKTEMDAIHLEMRQKMQYLESQLMAAKQTPVEVHIGDSIGGDRVGNDKAGADITHGDKNSDRAIRYMLAAIVALVGMVAWLFYYVAVTKSDDGKNIDSPTNRPNIVSPK